jgi:hypothetical protein
MNAIETNNWEVANQCYLSAALSLVRNALEQHIARVRGDLDNLEVQNQQKNLQQALDEAISAMPAPAALTQLCAAFGLSPFERDVLLLCAGIELDSTFAALCAVAQGRQWNEHNGMSVGYSRISYPTFSLALAALPHAHWDALIPNAPLRRWRLITMSPGNALTLSPLRIDERILHYLAGVSHLDERLAGIVVTLSAAGELVPSHRLQAEQLTEALSPWVDTATRLSLPERGKAEPMPVVQLFGEDPPGKRAIAAAACTALGLNLCLVPADALPATPSEIEALTRLWEREAVLSGSALMLDCDELDMADAARTIAVTRLIQQMNSPLIVTSLERSRLSQRRVRQVITLDVRKPSMSEQRTLWHKRLNSESLNGHIEALVSQFNLSASSIHAASSEVLAVGRKTPAVTDNRDSVQQAAYDELADLLWDACRGQTRPALDDLAQRIEPSAGWDDLVLPEAQREILHEIAAHVRQRATVYEAWGFSTRGTRGLGISALFAGASGTGKTMAAEVLAHELRLDLYRIDLSSVVSKYIGETEKNLRRVFDAAEEGGAILLFDEADALFGKRSEVKDSHDRYANIEVSYLLQRMEAYRGLAILTTNLKNALDTAFLRRIRFVVQFPFPDAAQRAEIWRRIFPQLTPTKDLDIDKLARLNVAGGNIRNIALNAAFLAADAQEPVGMAHLLRAANTEYAKIEKSLTETEIGGWA